MVLSTKAFLISKKYGRTTNNFYIFQRHGFGILEIPSEGSRFIGTFQNDRRIGQGRYEGKDCVYEGDFVNDVFHGKGKCSFSDGRYYDGEFVDGRVRIFYFFLPMIPRIKFSEVFSFYFFRSFMELVNSENVMEQFTKGHSILELKTV